MTSFSIVFDTIDCNFECTQGTMGTADICAYCFFKYADDDIEKALDQCSKSFFFGSNDRKADDLLLKIYYELKA